MNVGIILASGVNKVHDGRQEIKMLRTAAYTSSPSHCETTNVPLSASSSFSQVCEGGRHSSQHFEKFGSDKKQER